MMVARKGLEHKQIGWGVLFCVILSNVASVHLLLFQTSYLILGEW